MKTYLYSMEWRQLNEKICNQTYPSADSHSVCDYFSFLWMMRIAGSDVVTQKMENTGQILSEDKLNAAREQLGLDKPFLTQYFVWLGKLLHGDMGNSYVSSLPVFDTFISKLPATLLLTVTSILLTIIISIPLGILAAVNRIRSQII